MEELHHLPCASCGETEFTVILKPDTLHRLVCPKCKTPTYIYVSPKLDIITIREDELCPECGGTGKCSNCNGTGKARCSHCEGHGWIYDASEDFYYPCPHCGGSKKSNVYWSSYEDFIDHVLGGDVRLGSGVGPCFKCMGSGACPSCHGLRFRPKSSGKVSRG